jgi:hypothetical protein
MKLAEILALVVQFGPTIVPLVSKLTADIKNRGEGAEVTEADWTELNRLANQSSSDIYARLGIEPPPPQVP